jgi:trans-aconitate 2-methyltransferase
MVWNPERYLAFGDQRTRPAVDLLARVALERPERVTDLGCGPGNSTRLLVERWPDAHVNGIDNSPEMLARARTAGIRATWVEADIATWVPDAPCDVLFSNAALHWLPDHTTLLPRLLGQVRSGGVLAVQMPRNFRSPSHVLLRQTASADPWADRVVSRLARQPVATPERYYDLLCPLTASLDIWQTEYLHVLDGDDPVLDWTRSTAMRPVIEALCPEEQVRFETKYAARLRAAYPKRTDGRTLFPFRRLFIVAVNV